MAALLFTNNPTTAHMHPMVSEIKIFFDEGGAVVFSEGQTEKQLPAGASLKAIVAFHDGSSSLYKPNNQVNFGEGQSISLISPSEDGDLIAETGAGKTGEWKKVD